VALLQALLLGLGLRALLDLFQLRGQVSFEDPRYLQRWRARGALAATLLAVWVVVLVPWLSGFGSHPVRFPGAARAVSLFLWCCAWVVPLFWLMGVVVRAFKRRRAAS
jgi:hypothetical protein